MKKGVVASGGAVDKLCAAVKGFGSCVTQNNLCGSTAADIAFTANKAEHKDKCPEIAYECDTPEATAGVASCKGELDTAVAKLKDDAEKCKALTGFATCVDKKKFCTSTAADSVIAAKTKEYKCSPAPKCR